MAIATIILLVNGAHGYHVVHRLAPERLTLPSAAFAQFLAQTATTDGAQTIVSSLATELAGLEPTISDAGPHFDPPHKVSRSWSLGLHIDERLGGYRGICRPAARRRVSEFTDARRASGRRVLGKSDDALSEVDESDTDSTKVTGGP